MRFLLALLISTCGALAATRSWTNIWNQTGYTAGDTVNLYGSAWAIGSGFQVTNSGTPGSPIQFIWQSGCSMAVTSVPSVTTFFNVDGRHDLIFDGGSGPSTPNTLSFGLLDNGTTSAHSPGTNTYSADNVKGFNGSSVGCTNITIQNMTIRGLYNRMGYTNLSASGTSGILLVGNGIVISNCFLGEMPDCIALTYTTGSSSNFTVVGCVITNYNHGIQVATASANSFFYNTVIARNQLWSGDMYETKDGMDVGLHRDPIFFFSEAPFPARSSMFSNCLVYGNLIVQGYQPQSTTAGTAAIFQDFYRTYQAAHMWVYNNISILRSPLQWSGGGGMVGTWGIDALVANNTCASWSTNGVYGGGSPGWTVAGTNAWGYNNLCIAEGGMWIETQCDTTGKTTSVADFQGMMSGVFSDKNVFNGQGNQSFVGIIFDTNTAAFVEPIYHNLASARADYFGTSHDANSKTNTVTIDSAYYLSASDTIARLSGTNLTTWGITNDFYGQARPSTGNWTIGAVEGISPAVIVTNMVMHIARTNFVGYLQFFGPQ